MKSKRILCLLIAVLLLGALSAGCKDKTPPPPNISEQKKIIDVYLEGMKHEKKANIINTIDPETAAKYAESPDKLDLLFEAQKSMGEIQKWDYTGTQTVDEVNQQALINVSVVYPRFIYQLQFDLRKEPGVWKIYDVKPGKRLQKK